MVILSWAGFGVGMWPSKGKVIDEFDYLEAVKIVNQTYHNSHPYLMIIMEIKEILVRDWLCVLYHVIREQGSFGSH